MHFPPGTQTSMKFDEEGEEEATFVPRYLVTRSLPAGAHDAASPPAVATHACSTADEATSTPLSSQTQTRNRDLEPKGALQRERDLCLNTSDYVYEHWFTRQPCEILLIDHKYSRTSLFRTRLVRNPRYFEVEWIPLRLTVTWC